MYMRPALAVASLALLFCCLPLIAQNATAGSPTNPVVEAILRSGTTRAFTSRPVDEKALEVIVQCGIRAPSAQNAQPWHFCVVTRGAMLEKLRGSAPGGARDPFFGSSTILVISGRQGWQWSQFDCALACQNMSLAAQSFGLGAHISASANRLFNDAPSGPQLKKALGIPDGMAVVAVLVVGVPEVKADAVSSASPRNSTGVATYVK